MSGDVFDEGVDVDAAWAEIVSNWDTTSEASADETPEASAGASETDRLSGTLSWDALDYDADHAGPDPVGQGNAGGQESISDPLTPGTRDQARVVQRAVGPRDVDPEGPSLLDALDDDPDERYIPPDPPPLPRPRLVSGLAWLGAIGAPLFLLMAALFWRTIPALWIGAAVLAFVAGFVTLIVRMPDREEGSDGAVV